VLPNFGVRIQLGLDRAPWFALEVFTMAPAFRLFKTSAGRYQSAVFFYLNRRPVLLLAVGALNWLALAPAGFGHGAVHEQIAALSGEIEKKPRDPVLYLKRGELHRAHQDWDAAQADFDTAGALNPNLAPLDYLRGRLYHEAGWNLSARVALDRFLARNTNSVEALITRARTLVKLSQPLAAAGDYARALTVMAEPAPEVYIERSQALAAAGDAHLDAAVRCLDEGIRKLGPLVTLELFAIDLEVKRKNFDAALRRVDTVSGRLPRKETWLAKRGEILQQAGRTQEARAAFQASLAAINALPPARRNVPAMMELQKRLQENLVAPTNTTPAVAPPQGVR
jgi:tetratricopeptide (TPR) repeat protein